MIHRYSLERALRQYPDVTAIVDGGARTFRELYARVGALAAWLKQRGLAPGDRLALLLPNSVEYLELLYACAWLGVTAVPINTRLAVAEIDRILLDAMPQMLIRHSQLPVPTISVPQERILDFKPVRTGNDAPPEPLHDPDAVLALIYTSGTTGRPKGVKVSHAAIVANIEHANYWMPLKENSVFLHAAPLFHIADFPFVFACPAFGVRQVTVPKFTAAAFCETVQRERVTRTVLVPTMINLLLQSKELEGFDLQSLEELSYGGSPMAPELIRQVRQCLPKVKLLQVYGLSETGFLTGLKDHEHESHLTSCGRTAPGIDLRAVDSLGQELPMGQPGELRARGANVSIGYWNNPEETAATFGEGSCRTGDVGYRDEAGYFYILDRVKDMIVSGGENIYCGEVEAALYAHPAVREAAVFGIPDPQWGELVAASVVLKSHTSLTPEQLVQHCRQTLASYKVPRRIEFSAVDLPKSGAGKILKRLLREKFWVGAKRAVG